MSNDLNKTVADFEYKNRRYEIDLLLDSVDGFFATYDIFDITDDKNGDSIGFLELEQAEEDDYILSELIELAKDEIDGI